MIVCNVLNNLRKTFFAFLLLLPISCLGDQFTTILILGDSLSSGYGLKPKERWTDLLMEQLEQSDEKITLVNDSISGDTTAGGLARIRQSLKRHAPDWVVIELGGNDGLRGMSLEAMRSNLQAMIDIVRDHRAMPFLIGVELPPNYGSVYTNDFKQVYSSVSESTGTPLLANLSASVRGNPDLMQEDNIHPNAAAQPIVKHLVWEFLKRYR